MKTIPKIILVLFVFNGLQTFAQQKNETLVSLINQAIEYYPRIKEQQQLISINESKDQISRSQYLPSITGDASYTYVNPISKVNFAGNNLAFQPNNNWNTSININQLIYDFGKTSSSIEKDKTEILLSKDNLESVKNIIAYQISSLYYGVIYLQRSIEVQNAQLNLLKENQKVISDRIKNGDEIDFNLISTQVRYKNTETRLIDIQNQLDKQYIILSTFVGKDVRPQIDSKTGFLLDAADVNIDNALSQAEMGNWDLKMSKIREEIALKDVQITQKGKLPTLSFNGSVGFKNGYQPDIYKYQFNQSAGVRLSVPIFSGFRNNYQTDIARKNYQLSKYSTETQNLTLKSNIQQALSDLQAVKTKLDLSEAQVQQAEYAVKLAESRYKNGVITSLEQLTAQTALQEAQLNKIQFDYQLILAKLELNKLAGTNFWAK